MLTGWLLRCCWARPPPQQPTSTGGRVGSMQRLCWPTCQHVLRACPPSYQFAEQRAWAVLFKAGTAVCRRAGGSSAPSSPRWPAGGVPVACRHITDPWPNALLSSPACSFGVLMHEVRPRTCCLQFGEGWRCSTWAQCLQFGEGWPGLWIHRGSNDWCSTRGVHVRAAVAHCPGSIGPHAPCL